jgi:hypothetical protein
VDVAQNCDSYRTGLYATESECCRMRAEDGSDRSNNGL